MLKRLLPITAALILGLSACGSDDSEPDEASDTAGATESGSCEYPESGEAAKDVDAPPAEPTVDGETTATIATSAGDVEITLDPSATPCTVNSFVSLAEQGYFDGTTCHRLTTEGIFVLQCGDPTGSGAGGPGYSFDDELSGDETYEAGTVAMANAGPNTNGSQFFLVYGDSPLQPDYNVFGTMSADAVKVVDKVAKGGVDLEQARSAGDGAPKNPVEITGVEVG